MMMTIPALWWRWLAGVAVAVAVFGASLVLLPGPMAVFFNWLIYGTPGEPASFSPEAIAYNRFVYGVLGAVMVGWMVPLLFLILGPFRRGERYAWWAIAASVLVWFVLDTPWSVATGFVNNALFNVPFFVLFGLPLAATYRRFNPRAR